MKSLLIEFDRRPSAAAFMLNALRPSSGLRRSGGFPPIAVRWRGHRTDQRELRDFSELTGLCADALLPILYPHVFGFRLQMVILTHPTFPLPIWSALQIRNRLLQHHPISVAAMMNFETRVAGQRILEKGAEVDLHTIIDVDGERMWESLNTFYYRGRFGGPEQISRPNEAPPSPSRSVSRWRLPSRIGWRFAAMTGDYNGIHRWHWYARLFGFRRAFFHSQMIVGQCMSRLPSPGQDRPQRLDLWLKGPVYFGSEVELYADILEAATQFAVIADGEERPAILGCWAAAEAHDQLRDAPFRKN